MGGETSTWTKRHIADGAAIQSARIIRMRLRMQGPWTPISKRFERSAADESGPGWTEEARMQGHPWEGC
eukprot:3196307-Pyramimonas_sp.AAC.1